VIPGHWRRAALAPPFAWGSGPIATGALRTSSEDFKVDEILGFEAGGEGPHALLHVRKSGANTEWVARELARTAGCKPFDVGFAGLKDRNAVTTQYFTVPRGKRAAEEFVGVTGEGYEVIAAAPHQRKLPRGALAGNRFEITVRTVAGDRAELSTSRVVACLTISASSASVATPAISRTCCAPPGARRPAPAAAVHAAGVTRASCCRPRAA